MMFWSNISKIFFAELKKIFTDGGSLLIMVTAIFLYSIIYGFTYYNQVVRDVPIGVIDNDNSQFSRQLIRDIDSTEQVKVVSRPSTMIKAVDEYSKDKIRAFIVIPSDFEKNILSGESANVVLEADSTYMIIYRQVYQSIMTVVTTLSHKYAIAKTSVKTKSLNSAIAEQMPFKLVQEPLFNSVGGYENYVFPTILILILQQTMLIGVGLLSGRRREKEPKFCEFENTTPSQILLGRSFAYVFLYGMYGTIYFLIYPHIFGYGLYPNLPLMFLTMFLFLFACAFLAQALGIFYNTKEDSLLALVMSAITLVFLAGVVWRKEDIPLLIRYVSDFIPSTWGVDALVRINQMGANFSQVAESIIWLVFLTILFYFLGTLSVKKLVEEKEQNEPNSDS